MQIEEQQELRGGDQEEKKPQIAQDQEHVETTPTIEVK
jgi:hypothetical protein